VRCPLGTPLTARIAALETRRCIRHINVDSSERVEYQPTLFLTYCRPALEMRSVSPETPLDREENDIDYSVTRLYRPPECVNGSRDTNL
jgi:hypothetical protein